jgi:hypothetical protein
MIKEIARYLENEVATKTVLTIESIQLVADFYNLSVKEYEQLRDMVL